jgi:hypothetical protein
MAELHETYAPILHFAQGEQFYPLRAEHLLAYSALYAPDQGRPLVAEGRLTADALASTPGETYLCSLGERPLSALEVARSWGSDTLQLLSAFASNPRADWTAELAHTLYDWFSDKTAAATTLFWWNKLLLRRDRPLSGELPRLRLPGDVRARAIARYQGGPQGQPRPAYYYRLSEQRGFLNLQYWFLYAYNDWAAGYGGFNDHEGDWEGVQLFFPLQGGRPSEPPAAICYQGHNSRITKPWDHADIHKTGTHPHVYVAAGSHASYPERKPYTIMALYNLIDHALGDGLVLEPGDWGGRIDLDRATWVSEYRGSWGTRYWLSLRGLRTLLLAAGMASDLADLPGELALPGVSAPRGPHYDDEGLERITWADAVTFAGLGG